MILNFTNTLNYEQNGNYNQKLDEGKTVAPLAPVNGHQFTVHGL